MSLVRNFQKFTFWKGQESKAVNGKSSLFWEGTPHDIPEERRPELRHGGSVNLSPVVFLIAKAISLQACRGPEGCRRLRLPDLKTIHT
jgi:hypothetical protein